MKIKKFLVFTLVLVTICSCFGAVGSNALSNKSFVEFSAGNFNIASAATSIAVPESIDDINAYMEEIQKVNDMLLVCGDDGKFYSKSGKELGAFADVIALFDSKILPVYEINSEAAMNAICSYLKETKNYDCIFSSKSSEIMLAAKKKIKQATGAIDFTDLTECDTDVLDNIVFTTNSANSKVAIISEKIATKDNVFYLQKHLITVWVVEETDNAALLHNAIQSGANGIVTDTPKDLKKAYYLYDDDEMVLVRRPIVIGHRGLPVDNAENSLESLNACIAAGADIIENDIRLSTDGTVYVFHDDDVERVTDGTGNIGQMTWEQISSLVLTDSAYGTFKETKIPTLREYFEAVKDQDVMIFVEIKESKNALVDGLCELIEEFGYENKVVIISFYTEMLEYFHEKMPGISVGYLMAVPDGKTVADKAESIIQTVSKYNSTCNPANLTDSMLLKALMNRGITVWSWTYSTGNTASTYLYGMGGVTTDDSSAVKDFPVSIELDEDSYNKTISIGKKVTFSPTVATRTGTLKDADTELVVIDGEDLVEIEGNKVKALATGTVHLMYRCNVTASSSSEEVEYKLYTQVITLNITEKSAGCSSSITSGSFGLLLLITAAFVMFLKRKKIQKI